MFDRLVGNERVKDVLRRMVRERRVPGALLFAGEDGVGKKEFALELAKALNCRAPREDVEACDNCPACKRIVKFVLPNADDKDAHKKIIWSEHADVGLALPYGRSILVDLVRDIEREANFRPFEGAARFFIIEDADKLNDSSSNALLKTLEEPPPTSHLILITSRPAALLPTIRSRCQTIHFAPLSIAEIEAYLLRERKYSEADARLLARAARGSLGRALATNIARFREQRAAMLDVLTALALTGDRTKLLRAAEDLSDVKRKDEYEPRLDVLATLIHDAWMIALGAHDGEPLVNADLHAELARIGARFERGRAASWLSEIEELRRRLGVNINRKVATDALFLTMAANV